METDKSEESASTSAAEVVARFGKDLAELRELHGSPSFADMHNKIRHLPGVAGSKNTFHRMIARPTRIVDPAYVRGYVLALGLSEDDAKHWELRRQRAVADLQQSRSVPKSRLPEEPNSRTRNVRSRVLLAIIVGVAVVGAIGVLVRNHWSDPHPQVAITPVSSPTASRTPGEILGPINIQAACDHQYGHGRIARPANPKNAFTWQCFRPGETVVDPHEGVELSIQCIAQFGSGTTAKSLYSDDPRSWRCIQAS